MTKTLEAPINQEQWSQQDQNQELLRNSELGVFLERAYTEAIKLDPRLADIKVVQLDENSPNIAQAAPSWATESGKMEARIKLDNLDGALAKHQEVLDNVPGARELLSQKVGVRPEELTPAILHVFASLHEMGHLTEFMDNESDPEALRQRSKREKAALPIGNATVSALMTPGTPARELVDNKWSEVQSTLDVETIGDLLEIQHAAHRNMTSERIADNFATDVFASNPELIGALLSPDVVEDYRDYPAAA
jgi:hypothetical protein